MCPIGHKAHIRRCVKDVRIVLRVRHVRNGIFEAQIASQCVGTRFEEECICTMLIGQIGACVSLHLDSIAKI